MTEGVQARLDDNMLVLRIPTRFQRRGGRKRIIAPDGSAIVPSSKPQPDGTLAKALVRAWRWQRMLDEGVYTSVSEIGDTENISKSYVSRILRLALLAPDIVEAILDGQADQALMLERLERPLPASWEQQRRGSGSPIGATEADWPITPAAASGAAAREQRVEPSCTARRHAGSQRRSRCRRRAPRP